MTLRILDLAEADLLRGFRFYERKSPGVGWYFLDSLSAEIEFLAIDDQTRLRQFKQELCGNEVDYALRSGFVS